MPLFTVWALLLVSAPAPVAPAATVTSAAPAAVVVKLGNASLEEYRHGDPANRVQMLRGTQSANKS